MPGNNPKTLILILGDQLSTDLASLRAQDPTSCLVVMAEVMEEATYVPHHKAKLALVFSAMRHFAQELREEGWTVAYRQLDAPDNPGSLFAEIQAQLHDRRIEAIRVVEAGEYRLASDMAHWQDRLGIPVYILEDDRYTCSLADFNRWAEGRKSLRMEYFYRERRRALGLLMDGDKPIGGKWNFDAENRKPAASDLFRLKAPRFSPDAITDDVLAMVAARFPDHPGQLAGFGWATSRAEAERARDFFMDHLLPGFGDYQDAMLTDDPFLYHSLLAPYLNIGLLDPLDLCRRAEVQYHEGKAPLNAVEGYIRQIIGWRDYVRGIYWRQMPAYADMNVLGHDRPLPDFYWTGETEMNCLKHAIGQTLEHAYAHHIQRLMITGNFGLLAGVSPQALHEWYLAIYADAYEWVEMPNTLGMSQFADGGLLGSKPYISGGNYINKMSDYCAGCRFNVKQRVGQDACPFNALYWAFLARHENKLKGNPRLGPVYRTWGRMKPEDRAATLDQADGFLSTL